MPCLVTYVDLLWLVWLTGSGGEKRYFMRSKESISYLVGVLRGEKVKKVLFMGSHFLHFIKKWKSMEKIGFGTSGDMGSGSIFFFPKISF